jgi:hypothetical protein
VIDAMTDTKRAPTDHELRLKSIQYRRKILESIVRAGAGHTGGSLSCTDILNVLYYYSVKILSLFVEKLYIHKLKNMGCFEGLSRPSSPGNDVG